MNENRCILSQSQCIYVYKWGWYKVRRVGAYLSDIVKDVTEQALTQLQIGTLRRLTLG